MIVLKTKRELDLMREACRISANALKVAGQAIEPGVSTKEIDDIVRKYIQGQGATPSFLGYGEFPASACISVHNVVIRGIPSKKQILKSGEFLLFCTDGLSNFVEPEFIFDTVKNSKVDDITEILVNKANSNGGGDNITAVLVAIDD